MRTCPNCKWEFPHTYTRHTCKFCGTLFDIFICSYCGEWKQPSEFYDRKNRNKRGYCKVCSDKAKKKYDDEHPEMKKARSDRLVEARKDLTDRLYDEWKNKTKLHTKILSEQQWLEACSYFNGCALCGESHIETRQYFVPFKDGGKYTACNIFPMCGKCSVRTRNTINPFRWFDKTIGTTRHFGIDEEHFNRLVAYLELQIEKAGKLQ